MRECPSRNSSGGSAAACIAASALACVSARRNDSAWPRPRTRPNDAVAPSFSWLFSTSLRTAYLRIQQQSGGREPQSLLENAAVATQRVPVEHIRAVLRPRLYTTPKRAQETKMVPAATSESCRNMGQNFSTKIIKSLRHTCKTGQLPPLHSVPKPVAHRLDEREGQGGDAPRDG